MASTSTWVIDVGEADFNEKVVEQSRQRPVVVDFWAPWCGPCRALGPMLERLVNERKGDVVLAKVNVDDSPNLAAQFGVQGIPTVVAFRDGQMVLDFVGVLPEARLREFLDRISPSETERLARRAAELEKTSPLEAEQLYRQILEKERDQEEAVIGLARLLISRNQDEEAAELLSRTGPGGKLGDEFQRLDGILFLRQKALEAGSGGAEAPRRLYQEGCALAAAGKYPEALAALLSAAEQDPKLASSQVKDVMVKVFQVIGPRSPLADEYRDKLARLLY